MDLHVFLVCLDDACEIVRGSCRNSEGELCASLSSLHRILRVSGAACRAMLAVVFGAWGHTQQFAAVADRAKAFE